MLDAAETGEGSKEVICGQFQPQQEQLVLFDGTSRIPLSICEFFADELGKATLGARSLVQTLRGLRSLGAKVADARPVLEQLFNFCPATSGCIHFEPDEAITNLWPQQSRLSGVPPNGATRWLQGSTHDPFGVESIGESARKSIASDLRGAKLAKKTQDPFVGNRPYFTIFELYTIVTSLLDMDCRDRKLIEQVARLHGCFIDSAFIPSPNALDSNKKKRQHASGTKHSIQQADEKRYPCFGVLSRRHFSCLERLIAGGLCPDIDVSSANYARALLPIKQRLRLQGMLHTLSIHDRRDYKVAQQIGRQDHTTSVSDEQSSATTSQIKPQSTDSEKTESENDNSCKRFAPVDALDELDPDV